MVRLLYLVLVSNLQSSLLNKKFDTCVMYSVCCYYIYGFKTKHDRVLYNYNEKSKG